MALMLLSEAVSTTTILTTQLDSLAANTTGVGTTGLSALSAEISNDTATTERRTFCIARLTLAQQGSARSAGAFCPLFIAWRIGSTDDDALFETLEQVAVFPLDAATTARVVTRVFPVNATYGFKLALGNRTGQAFASSGNTLAYATFAVESV